MAFEVMSGFAVAKDLGSERQIVLKVPTPYAALYAASCSDLVATVGAGLARGVAEDLQLVCRVTYPLNSNLGAWASGAVAASQHRGISWASVAKTVHAGLYAGDGPGSLSRSVSFSTRYRLT